MKVGFFDALAKGKIQEFLSGLLGEDLYQRFYGQIGEALARCSNVTIKPTGAGEVEVKFTFRTKT
jgi:hypothetical protein